MTTLRTCRACYKQYRYPQARGFERIDDGYCSYACVPTSDPTPSDAGIWREIPETVMKVLVDQSTDTPSISFEPAAMPDTPSSDWGSSTPDTSDSGFGGGGCSGDF